MDRCLCLPVLANGGFWTVHDQSSPSEPKGVNLLTRIQNCSCQQIIYIDRGGIESALLEVAQDIGFARVVSQRWDLAPARLRTVTRVETV